MSGSVAFIIDIAGATLRNAHLRLLTLLCSLRSAAGVRSATLNRCAPPIGQTGPVALSPPQPIFPSCFLTYLRRFGLVSYTYREHKKRSAPSLNTFVKTKRGFGYTQPRYGYSYIAGPETRFLSTNRLRTRKGPRNSLSDTPAE